MKLIIDIGNTSINFALFDNNILIKMMANKEKEKYSSSYFECLIKEFCGTENIEDIYISSVVPKLNELINESSKQLFPKVDPYFISCDSKLNFDFEIDNKSEVGADLIADIAIGKEKYGYPLLIADLGTATKFLYINERGNFESCNFIPGLTLSLKIMASSTALLPEMHVKACDKIIAKNTYEAMNSGVVFAQLGAIKKIFESYEKYVGHPIKKVLTGGCAIRMKDLLEKEYILDENFLLEGINYLGNLRRKL